MFCEKGTTQCGAIMNPIDETRQLIDLFKAWGKGRVLHTGRVKNANKMIRPLLLFKGFVSAHADFFDEHFEYKH